MQITNRDYRKLMHNKKFFMSLKIYYSHKTKKMQIFTHHQGKSQRDGQYCYEECEEVGTTVPCRWKSEWWNQSGKPFLSCTVGENK